MYKLTKIYSFLETDNNKPKNDNLNENNTEQDKKKKEKGNIYLIDFNV